MSLVFYDNRASTHTHAHQKRYKLLSASIVSDFYDNNIVVENLNLQATTTIFGMIVREIQIVLAFKELQ